LREKYERERERERQREGFKGGGVMGEGLGVKPEVLFEGVGRG